jgi:hypothetical protein
LQTEIPFSIIVFSGVVVLPIAIRRSKDKLLKRQLTWFAVYLMWFVFLIVVGDFLPSAPEVVALAVFLAGAYPLYRSATSLVPLYKFSPDAGTS